MMRKTEVFSSQQWTASEPGPVAVKMTSSALCTPASKARGMLPSTLTAPGLVRYFSLAA